MKLVFAIACFVCFCLFLGVANKNEITQDKSDCAEFGLCKEGLTIFWNDKETTITKDFCLKNNYKWHEKKSSCFVR